MIYAHDTVRVVECLVALGDESIRNSLFEEMKEDVIGKVIIFISYSYNLVDYLWCSYLCS